MTEKDLSPYTPKEHFVEAEKLPPVIQGAVDDDTELWLIRLPANEIRQADLQKKRVKLNLDALEGKVGDFANEQGREYNIIRHRDSEVLQPYAIIPTGNGPFKVRKITRTLGCVMEWNVGTNESRGGPTVESDKDASASGIDQENDVSSGRQQGVDSDTSKKHRKSKRRKSE